METGRGAATNIYFPHEEVKLIPPIYKILTHFLGLVSYLWKPWGESKFLLFFVIRLFHLWWTVGGLPIEECIYFHLSQGVCESKGDTQYLLVSHNKQTALSSEWMCVVLCVMFALGRQFEDKQCFVTMVSVILKHTLLQVQSGDNNMLSKYTHTHTHSHTSMA